MGLYWLKYKHHYKAYAQKILGFFLDIFKQHTNMLFNLSHCLFSICNRDTEIITYMIT